NLIHLNKEANSAAIKTNINCQYETMIVAHAKGDFRDGKKKGKSKSKDKEKQHCDNCNKDRHTKDKCFEDDGGKAPEWWLQKHKDKSKDKVDK
ncbi:hypothetical protein C0995_014795, partial [Termitomyces sp. Mi166